MMLKNTFLHLPGVGEHTERAIWHAGIGTWMELMNAAAVPGFSTGRLAGLRTGVLESIQKYEAGNWNHFEHSLPGRHKWRAFGDFPEKALYVDIETDGGMGPESITVIGAYDGEQTHLFVKDRNLDAARELIEAFPVVVTFNGARFDMPIIRSRFCQNFFNHIHIDLLFPLRRLGHTGGLKHIEKKLGLARSGETEGLDGWAAVHLWRAYCEGSEEALRLLLRYNEEDIRNLQPLMRLCYEQLATPYPLLQGR